MERTKALATVIGAAPPVIAGLLAVAFPNLVLYLLGALIAVWVVAVLLWQYFRILDLQSKVEKLEQQPKPKSAPIEKSPPKPKSQLVSVPVGGSWKMLESIELYLEVDGTKVTKTHHLSAGTTLRVTVTGSKRFHARLATDLQFRQHTREPSLWKWSTVEEFSETKNLQQLYDISEEKDYAIVVEPAGRSPFWVSVKIEQELKSHSE